MLGVDLTVTDRKHKEPFNDIKSNEIDILKRTSVNFGTIFGRH